MLLKGILILLLLLHHSSNRLFPLVGLTLKSITWWASIASSLMKAAPAAREIIFQDITWFKIVQKRLLPTLFIFIEDLWITQFRPCCLCAKIFRLVMSCLKRIWSCIVLNWILFYLTTTTKIFWSVNMLVIRQLSCSRKRQLLFPLKASKYVLMHGCLVIWIWYPPFLQDGKRLFETGWQHSFYSTVTR